MPKKLHVLILLFATSLWAADFWTSKPYTDWSDREIQKILSDSPWAGKVTVTVSSGLGGGGGATGGGGGGRGGGRGGGSGPRGDGADPGDAAGGAAAGGGAGASAGGGGGTPGTDVTLLWQTAVPVKQAMMKRKFGSEVGASPEAKAFIERKDEVYALTMVGLPGTLAMAAQGDDKKAALLATTTIEVKGKEPVKPTDVQISISGRTANLSFLFPRTTNFTADDKEMEFSTKFDKTSIKHKFKLKDMVINGKVEM